MPVNCYGNDYESGCKVSAQTEDIKSFAIDHRRAPRPLLGLWGLLLENRPKAIGDVDMLQLGKSSRPLKKLTGRSLETGCRDGQCEHKALVGEVELSSEAWVHGACPFGVFFLFIGRFLGMSVPMAETHVIRVLVSQQAASRLRLLSDASAAGVL